MDGMDPLLGAAVGVPQQSPQPAPDTALLLLRALIEGQQRTLEKVDKVATEVVAVRQDLAGHREQQRIRTEGRNRLCETEERERADLWTAVGDVRKSVEGLQLAQASDRGGQSVRSTVAKWSAQIATMIISVIALLASWPKGKGG